MDHVKAGCRHRETAEVNGWLECQRCFALLRRLNAKCTTCGKYAHRTGTPPYCSNRCEQAAQEVK